MESTRQYQRTRFGAVLLTAMAVLTAAVVSTCAGQEAEETSHQAAFEGLQSESERTRDSAVDAILDERKAIIERLIPLIDPANAGEYSDETRAASAYLLGELRAAEAAPVLAKAVADRIGRQHYPDMNRYDESVFEALIKIGRPSVPALIENLRSSDDRPIRDRSLTVLAHILGGKRRVLETLDKLIEQAQDEQPADREASRRLRAAHAHVESLLQGAIERGEKEPLY